jgi:putative hydrolase of the HAD superfamily
VGYQAVGFDLDGTLLDHSGASAAAIDAFTTWLGAPTSEQTRSLWAAAEDEQFEQWRAGRITFQEQRRRRLRSFLPAIQVDVPLEGEELDALFAQYLLSYRAAWRPFPDAVELLVTLHRQQIPIGVLSNGNHKQQLDKLASIGLDHYIGVVCTPERIGFAKPDPRAFHALANALGVEPAGLVFLGDNPEHDIAGARAAGLRAGLVERNTSYQVDLFEALATAQ